MKNKKRKVMAFGTFDLLHPGHVEFLRRAKALGDRLVVSVSRDTNARRFKGAAPVFSEKDRLKLVGVLRFVDKAVLGDKRYYLSHVLKERPDIIALGYDQTAYVSALKADIKKLKLKIKIRRLPAFKTRLYKSSKFKSRIKRQNV
ncbi:MAG: adenylyltransferase/cytidyltransferase family protein [Patescibacteria group bacterium]|nr:adenylyltransferase/cytidyltransferase family protein [Patescibacteria group bacterium]